MKAKMKAADRKRTTYVVQPADPDAPAYAPLWIAGTVDEPPPAADSRLTGDTAGFPIPPLSGIRLLPLDVIQAFVLAEGANQAMASVSWWRANYPENAPYNMDISRIAREIAIQFLARFGTLYDADFKIQGCTVRVLADYISQGEGVEMADLPVRGYYPYVTDGSTGTGGAKPDVTLAKTLPPYVSISARKLAIIEDRPVRNPNRFWCQDEDYVSQSAVSQGVQASFASAYETFNSSFNWGDTGNALGWMEPVVFSPKMFKSSYRIQQNDPVKATRYAAAIGSFVINPNVGSQVSRKEPPGGYRV